MTFDCFLSYQHEDLSLVESIVEELEKRGLKCWYAPRNVRGRYAKAIADGINNSKVFVLILSRKSVVSEAVLNEVELAHNVSKSGPYAELQPVCIEELDLNAYDYQEMMYYIRRRQFVNAYLNNDPSAIADAIIKNNRCLSESVTQRYKSKYVVQDIEDRRLELQNELLKSFDNEVYQNVIDRYMEPRILDVGCGRGDMLIRKIAQRSISAFVGVDKSARQIDYAKSRYLGENYTFLELDVEEEFFENKLRVEMDLRKIDEFDIVNVSMVLLHLDNPTKLLTKLYGFMSDQGTIIIRDIDDGINFAFPDSTNAFERIYQMCARDEQSGNRTNGRQIFSALYDAGYKEIRLERQGLSTVGMSVEEKDALFNMYFPFTLENAGIMMEKYPWNSDCKKDYLWYKQNYDNIHNAFLEPNFVFSLGFMNYTARKRCSDN